MKIPFFDYVVTKDNFYSVEDFENHNIIISHEKGGIQIKFKMTYPTNFFFVDGACSLDEELLANYLRTTSKGITINKDFITWERKKVEDKPNWSIRQLEVNRYNEINRISCLWDNLIVHPDLTFEVMYYKNIPLNTIPINESKELFKRWIKRYENLFSSIEGNNLVWELSAGLDSRALTHFYHKPTLVFSQDTFEFPTAEMLCQRLGVDITKEKPYDRICVHGIGNFRVLTIGTLENWVGCLHTKHLVKDVCPYLDKEFLMLSGEVKKILNVLLCPELIDIPYFTFCDRPYVFSDKIISETKNKIKEIGL